jgi:hypothetical protein
VGMAHWVGHCGDGTVRRTKIVFAARGQSLSINNICHFHIDNVLIDKYTDNTSNGNASKTKANESFNNGFFFDIEAKRTSSIVSKLFTKRSEHIT